MAKGILKFDLSDKYEEEHFRLATKCVDLYMAIKSFDDALREKVKYQDDSIAARIREELQGHLDAYDVTLDMLS